MYLSSSEVPHELRHPGSGRGLQQDALPAVTQIIAGRRGDGWLPGSNGSAWILTDAEAEAILGQYQRFCTAYQSQVAAEVGKAQAAQEAIFARARATGQRQLLSSEMCGCDGSAKDCSTDCVTLWATPDGRTTTTRTHTY